jgi:hypothetical protein
MVRVRSRRQLATTPADVRRPRPLVIAQRRVTDPSIWTLVAAVDTIETLTAMVATRHESLGACHICVLFHSFVISHLFTLSLLAFRAALDVQGDRDRLLVRLASSLLCLNVLANGFVRLALYQGHINSLR